MSDNVFAARPASTTDRSEPMDSSRSSSRLPLIDPGVLSALALTLVALILWGATQTWLLLAERGNLRQALALQNQQIEAASKVRGQLDAIATGMQRLSDGGNSSARLVVDELRKRGVTISVGAGSPGTATSGTPPAK